MLVVLYTVFFSFFTFLCFFSSPTQPFQRHIFAMTRQFSVYLRFRNSWDVINRSQSARDKENGNVVRGWLNILDADCNFRCLWEWKHSVWNALLSRAEEPGLMCSSGERPGGVWHPALPQGAHSSVMWGESTLPFLTVGWNAGINCSITHSRATKSECVTFALQLSWHYSYW